MITVEIDNTAGRGLGQALAAIMEQVHQPTYMLPLLDQVGDLILEDNRAGVLAGLDKDMKPAPPLRYRRTSGKVAQPHAQLQRGKMGPNRGPAKYELRSTKSKRFGTVHEPMPLGVNYATILPNNNLTNAQYRKLTGPRLAPRFEGSRSIANLRKVPPFQDATDWIVEAAWADFLDKDGDPILPWHFDSTNPAFRYDLRGVRKPALAKIGDLVAEWWRQLFRANYTVRITRQ